VNALALHGSTLYVGGFFNTVGGETRHSLAAVDTRTGKVTRWAPEPLQEGYPTVIWSLLAHAGVIYAGGWYTTIGGAERQNVAALDPVTGQVTGWNPGADYVVHSFALHGRTLFIGGEFFHLGGKFRKFLAAVNVATGMVSDWDAHLDRLPLGSDVFGPVVRTLAIDGSTLYAGGSFNRAGSRVVQDLVALDLCTGAATPWDPQATGPYGYYATEPYIWTLLAHAGTVYVGGWFYSIGGRASSYIADYAAAVDGRTGRALDWNPRTNSTVVCMSRSGHTLYLGGAFTSIRDWVPRMGLAALDLTTGAATPWAPTLDGPARAMVVEGGTVYVAGQIGSVNGQPRANIAALDAVTGELTAWNPGANGPLWALVASGGTVYVGGSFNRIGGQPRANIAALDKATGVPTAWNPGASDIVWSLATAGDILYAGGKFRGIGGAVRNFIAALDMTSGAPTPWNPNADGTPVVSIAPSGPVVYAAGDFSHIGGQPRTRLAALDVEAGLATSWDPGRLELDVRTFPTVEVVATGLGAVYAGGAFITIGGQHRHYLAALDPQTGAVLDWDPDPNEIVTSIVVSDEAIYVGGSFSRMGATPASGIAAISLAGRPVVAGAHADAKDRFSLGPCSPNPARLNATIHFSLPSAGPVSLAVYDVTGRRVASLLDHELAPAGPHDVHVVTAGWQPGCYLYRLELNGAAFTRKMLVVK
jgi:hypothetical protein